MFFFMLLLLIKFLFLNILAGVPAFEGVGAVAYIGVDNEIRINLTGNLSEDIEVKSSAGTLFKRNDSTYVLVINQPEEEIKLKLYYKKIICDMKTLRGDRMPAPVLRFENETDGTFSRKNFKDLGKLQFFYPDVFPANQRAEVVSFYIMMKDASGRIIYRNNLRGDHLDTTSMNYFQKLMSGGAIIISNVITQNPYSGMRNNQVNKTVEIID